MSVMPDSMRPERLLAQVLASTSPDGRAQAVGDHADNGKAACRPIRFLLEARDSQDNMRPPRSEG